MHLMIVDDEAIIRNGLKHMASTQGSDCKSIRLAENGFDALSQIAEFIPDLVITDIRMPKMDGLELCKQLYEKYPYITVVVISGFAEFEYAQKCMSFGVKHYLLKPVVKKDIHELLDKLLPELETNMLEPSQVNKYVEEIAEYIWQLNEQQTSERIGDWLDYCIGKTKSPRQLQILLHDFYTTLLQVLQTKGHQSTVMEISLQGNQTEHIVNSFESALMRLLGELAQRRGGYKDVMKEAIDYIDSHLGTEITLEEVAQYVGLTPNYFSMYFKKTMGVTFVNYRMSKRMELAEHLLAQPHYRIVDVAHGVGYEDYSHFAKTFRKVKGSSPTEYRARLGIK